MAQCFKNKCNLVTFNENIRRLSSKSSSSSLVHKKHPTLRVILFGSSIHDDPQHDVLLFKRP